METSEEVNTQPIGLDVGTSRIVVARAAGKKYEYKSQLNAFFTLPYSRLAESLLQRENVFHAVDGDEIVVAGNDAEKLAEVFHAETRRPMKEGILNPQEPHAVDVVRRPDRKTGRQSRIAGPESILQHPGARPTAVIRRHPAPSGIDSPDSHRTGLRAHAHRRGPGGRVRRIERRQFQRHRHLLRQRTVQRLSGGSVGAGDQLQHPARRAISSTRSRRW